MICLIEWLGLGRVAMFRAATVQLRGQGAVTISNSAVAVTVCTVNT